MRRKFVAAASAVGLFSTSVGMAQVVVRPTVNVPVPKPVMKIPVTTSTPTPAPASTGHSTIPASIRTASLTVTGTAAGPEPTASPPVTIAERRDYNFTVPLHVSHMPAMYTDAEIRCVVSMAVNPLHPDPTALDHRVGEGANSVHLTNGGYSGDVEVHPFTDAGYDPTLGQVYYCEVEFVGTDRGTTFHSRPLRRYSGAPWTFEPPFPTTGAVEPDARGIIP